MRSRLALLVLVLASILASGVASASAAPSLRLGYRHAGPRIRLEVRAAHRPRSVSLSVDGRRLPTVRRRHGMVAVASVSARRLRPGRHLASAVAGFGTRTVRTTRVVRIRSTRPRGATASSFEASLSGVSSGQRVSGAVPVKVTVRGGSGRVAKVEFWTDGHRRFIDRTASYSWTWNTGGLSGDHVVGALAFDRAGRRVSTDNVHVDVSAGSGAPVAQDPPGSPYFRSSFESGNLNDWSVFDYDATIRNVSTSAEGIPAHDGSRAVKFEVTKGQLAAGQIHAKLYKIWTRPGGVHTGFHEDGDGSLAPSEPQGGDMSGTYSAWYYFPANYTRPSSNGGDWTTIWDWKQWYADGKQVVNWGVCVSSAQQWAGMRAPDGSLQWSGPRDDRPVMSIQGGSYDDWDYELREVPRGRWFQIKAVVAQGSKIDWYLDGAFWRTTSQSRFPVGAVPIPQEGESSRPDASIFSVGHYGGVGRNYVDDVTFTPSP
jgi:hypothetical protein